MSAKQKRKAAALIRDTCANCVQGICILLDTPCPQIHSDSLLCNWFKDAVLPQDRGLLDEIMRERNMKPCCICARPFKALSNRAKYCAECKGRERRRMEAKRLRGIRAADRG